MIPKRADRNKNEGARWEQNINLSTHKQNVAKYGEENVKRNEIKMELYIEIRCSRSVISDSFVLHIA